MKKWIMLTVCSAIFFAANAEQAPAENPAHTTVRSEHHHFRRTGKKFRQERKRFKRHKQSARHAFSKGDRVRAEHLHRQILNNRSNRRYGRNHLRNRHFKGSHYSRGK